VAAISSEQWGDDMASAEHGPITGVWGQSPHCRCYGSKCGKCAWKKLFF